MNTLATYLTTYWQPLLIFIVGLVVLLLVGYINWYKNIKPNTVRWIAKNIFRNGLRSDLLANNMFMVISSILLAFGLIWIGVAVLYLTA